MKDTISMPSSARPYLGVFPVVPTIFTESGELDLDGQKRCVDFMIDAGSTGLCILANFSEQFVLTDDERTVLMETMLAHVAGRVPVIVTTTHFSTRACAERSRRAQELGAAMVMVMPPYHGATIRVPEAGIVEFFQPPDGTGAGDDMRAGFRQFQGGEIADAARRAGDQREAAFQVDAHDCLQLSVACQNRELPSHRLAFLVKEARRIVAGEVVVGEAGGILGR